MKQAVKKYRVDQNLLRSFQEIL